MKHTVYVVKIKGRKTLQLRWQDANEKWHQKSTDTKRRREAARQADQLAKQLDSGVSFRESDWYQFASRYEVEKLSALRPKSRSDWKTASKSYEATMSPASLADLNASEISRFAGELREQGKSESTIAKYLGELRRALKWAAQLRLIDEAPYIHIPKVERDSDMHGRPVTTEEFERMLSKVEEVVGAARADSWKDTLYKYWLSSFRLAEGLLIYWDRPDRHCIENIDAKRPKLRIRGRFEKGRRDRLFPLTPDFVEYLRRTPESERTGPIIKPLSVRGETRDKGTVGRIISEIGEAAAVIVDVDPETGEKKYASTHDFRRSFGTRWAPLVKRPFVLQQLMRHKSIETTMKFYAEADAEITADEIWAAYGTRFCDILCDTSLIPDEESLDTR